jgi:hypothetical protein
MTYFKDGRNTCDHRDSDGRKEYTWYERDARGYMLGGRMCHMCASEVEADNRRRYRADVFSNSDYWHDEDLEPEAGVGRDDWHEDQGNGWSAADHYAEDLEYD